MGISEREIILEDMVVDVWLSWMEESFDEGWRDGYKGAKLLGVGWSWTDSW